MRMMLKVKIESNTPSTDRNEKWHDLMTITGRKAAYQHLQEIHCTDNDYIITDVESDWAKFDSNSSLDDMIETVKVLEGMIEEEVMLFKTLYCEGIHEPLDIAYRIKDSELKHLEDTLEDDEIWETVFSNKEQKELAIMY